MRSFFGSHWLTAALFIFAALIVIGDFLSTVFAIIYQRFWYDRVLRPRYKPTAQPSCTVIVPCKGLPKNFKENLQTFLALDYPRYEVIFVVESETDPAVAVIRAVAESNARARLAVAGLAQTCAQKNYNLLAAVRAANASDVLVFADADIGPQPSWLSELILPLSDNRVVVTTGFRWLRGTKPTVGEMTHNSVNVLLYTLLSVSSYIAKIGLWGGSMAMRRADFDALDVGGTWARTVVDDISLSSLVAKSGRKAVLVPACVTHTDDLIETVRGTVIWFECQIMFLKAYHRSAWLYGGVPLVTAAFIVYLWLPIALIVSLTTERTFWQAGGAAPLLFIVGEMAVALMHPMFGPVPRWAKGALLQPFMRATQAVSYFRTHLTNVVTWAGVRYHVARDGSVSKVERGGA